VVLATLLLCEPQHPEDSPLSDLLVIEFPSEAKAEGVREMLLAMQKEYLIEVGFHRRAQHRPRRQLPLNTNGGGLSYMHSGMYGMYALQESVRQMRGTAPAQIPGAKISVCHGVGGMFAASGTIIISNEAP
jgi:acetyl-CoA acetyltransferase